MTTNTANYKIFLEDVLKITCAGRTANDDEVVWSTKNQIESLLKHKSHWTYTDELLWEKCLISPAQLIDLTLTDPQNTIEKETNSSQKLYYNQYLSHTLPPSINWWKIQAYRDINKLEKIK